LEPVTDDCNNANKRPLPGLYVLAADNRADSSRYRSSRCTDPHNRTRPISRAWCRVVDALAPV